MLIRYTLIICALLPFAACKHADANADDHADDHGHDHGDEIILEPEMAEKMGVTTIQAQMQPFSESIPVAGQIVDSPNSSSIAAAPTAGIVKYAAGITPGKDIKTGTSIARIVATGIAGGDANAAAKATLDAAKAEMQRLKPLYDERLVTAKDYNAAVLAYEQAKAAYSSKAASGAVTAASSGVITQLYAKEGEYVEAGAPIAAIASSTKLTLKADLPQRYQALAPTLASAIIEANGQAIRLSQLGGRRISTGSNASAQKGYIPIYFEFDNDGSVLPGSFVKTYLLGREKDALVVPVTALTEQQGAYFVYKKVDEEGYEKIPVAIGPSNGLETQILSGIAPGDEIVATGAVALRLAETATAAPEGHSHSH